MNRTALGGCSNDSGALVLQFARDLFPAPHVRLDLHEHDRIPVVEPDIDRAMTRPGHARLHLGPPPWVSPTDNPLDDPALGEIEQQRRAVRVEGQSGP